MKKTILFFTLAFSAVVGFAQVASPVNWTFTSKKVSDNVYEVQMVATIQNGWHLYSQSQPKDAIAVPTTFEFSKNPLVQLDGKVKEAGKMERFTDKDLGVSANQYSKLVAFSQRVKLKGKAKSNVSGNVTYQTCDDKKCLPPKTVNFNIALK
ncbi:protein-disulfide reductase DsbD domain-containing protein [Flavisolibacter nicotianae]|uniref:protein-disulfide reductase DsbD domain-containing protein n=1 Tax=Flavisolibacter nicotianae TaxID=2364882 RepID=UPI000EAE9F05|nr:protein-disulfide reductase DsbD domain-containing protein [Flavisolibacter nicotianae]